MQILAKILGIKKGEYYKVLLLFLYNLFLVLMFRMGRMVNETLIVSRLGADKLTFSYLGTSIALAFSLYVYYKILDSPRTPMSIGVRGLLSITAAIFCITLLLSRWILEFQFDWFYQFLYILIEAFGTIMVTQFYTLASDIFNTRDAKRLFGIIGTGGVVGSIIGGFLTRYWAKSIGIENFFYVLAGTVFFCLVIINIIPNIIDVAKFLPKPRPQFQYSVLKSKHIRYISLLTYILIIVGTIVNFQFNKYLGIRYVGNESALLEFRGLFCIVLGIVSFFFQTFFTSRILLVFGLLAGLLILPGSILLGTIAILLGLQKLPFILNEGFDSIFGYTIDNSSRHIALLPINTEIRGRVKAFVEGIVKYASLGTAALILMLLIKLFKISYINLSYVVVIFILAWIYFAFMLKKEYINSVISGIKEKRIDLQEIELKATGHETIRLLEETLKEDEPEKVIYALDLLGEVPSFKLDPNLLNHPSPLVRACIIKRLDNLDLITSAFTDEAPEVISETIKSYCGLMKKDAIPRIKPFLENQNPDIRSSAIFGLIKYADYPLGPLINLFDSNKLEAIEIIGRLRLKNFADRIIPCLTIKGLKAVSFYALTQIGDVVCPELEEWLMDNTREESIRITIPGILAKIGTERAIAILLKHITMQEERLRDSIIRALHTTHRQFPPEQTADCMEMELENYYNTLYTLQGSKPTRLQEYILKDKILQYKERIYRLLEISYPVKLITNIKKIKMDSIEALDNLMDGELKKLVLPLLEDNPSLENAKKRFALKLVYPATMDRGGAKEVDMFPLVEEVLFLKGVPLFSQLPTEEIAKIAKITEEKNYERGVTIFNEGDPGDALYIIMRGKIEITKDNQHIKTLHEGDCLGELGMLDKEPRTAKAVVLEDAVLSRLGSEEFYELLSDNPQIAHGIFKILTEKLREIYGVS